MSAPGDEEKRQNIYNFIHSLNSYLKPINLNMHRVLCPVYRGRGGGWWSWGRGWGPSRWRPPWPRWRRWARTPRPPPCCDRRRPGPGSLRCPHSDTADLKWETNVIFLVKELNIANFTERASAAPECVSSELLVDLFFKIFRHKMGFIAKNLS